MSLPNWLTPRGWRRRRPVATKIVPIAKSLDGKLAEADVSRSAEQESRYQNALATAAFEEIPEQFTGVDVLTDFASKARDCA